MIAGKKFFRKIRYGKPVIIVSGLPRSGTSLIMQMLQAGGITIATDNIRKSDIDNPKGYYELEQVKELEKKGDKSWIKNHKGQAIKVISFLLRDLPENVNYKIIFVERSLDEILASQKKMLENRQEVEEDTSDDKMRENYKNHLLRMRAFLKHSSCKDSLFIQYKDMIANPQKAAEQIRSFLALPLDTHAMAACVDPELYRNRTSSEAT